MRRWFFRKRRVAGLDVGSRLVKLVELRETSRGPRLELYGQVPLHPGVIENGLVRDDVGLAAAVEALFRTSGSRAVRVVAALPGTAAVVKRASFPRMGEAAFRRLLAQEGEKYLPVERAADVNFDFHVLGGSPGDPGRMDVIVAAARKDVVERYVDAVEQGRRKVFLLDVDAFALARAYEANYDFGGGDTDALVHAGPSVTTVNVLKGGVSALVRSFPAGGLSVAKSRRAEALAGEVERSLDYYRSTAGETRFRQVLLSGGAVTVPAVREALAGRAHAPVDLFDPFRRIRRDREMFPEAFLDDIRPLAVAAVGLALRGVDGR